MHASHHHSSRLSAGGLLLLVVALLGVEGGAAVRAQDLDVGAYGKFGAGLSSYAGDLATGGTTPVSGVDANVLKHFPLTAAGELGYQFSPNWALALGGQAGSYLSVGDAAPAADSYRRYTSYLLGRYTFGAPEQRVSFYLDAGLNATFGGPTRPGIGPSVGGGIEVRAGRGVSVYVESRLHTAFPDEAIDGVGDPEDGLFGTRAFDAVHQPVGFGVTFSLTTPTAPEIVSLEGPAEVEAGTNVTFTATLNEEEAARPLSRRWTLGDGAEASGPTVTHTYGRPGTYTVAVSARNEAGEATETTTIRVTRAEAPPSAPKAPWVVSLSARPNPVRVGEPAQLRAMVEGDGPFAHQWTVGEETFEAGAEPTHTFERPGRYTVRVRSTNEAGTDTRSMTVHVESRAPAAPRSGAAPSTDWAIAVASMRHREGARAMARRYREQLAEVSGTVRIIQGDRGQERLYRVVVGRYETEDAARRARTQHRQALPEGAWTVRLPRGE